MTKQELNREVNRLRKATLAANLPLDGTEMAEFDNLQKKFNLLNRNMEYLNKRSILTLIALNTKYHFVPSHRLGIYLDLAKL